MANYLLTFMNGGIISFHEISNQQGNYGFDDTYDYNLVYTRNLVIECEHHKIEAEFRSDYGFPFTQGDLMQIILPNCELLKTFSEEKFIDWFHAQLLKFKSLKSYKCDDKEKMIKPKTVYYAIEREMEIPSDFTDDDIDNIIKRIAGKNDYVYSDTPNCLWEE